MNVGHIYYRFPIFSKTGSYYKEQLESLCLVDNKIQQTLITCKFPVDSTVKSTSKLKIVWLRYIDIPIIAAVLFELKVFISALFNSRFRKSDIIHVTNLRGVISGFLLSKILRTRLIFTIEILNSDRRNFIEKIVFETQRFVYTFFKPDCYICWSNYHANLMINDWKIDSGKIKIVTPGIDITKYNPKINGSHIRKKYVKSKDTKLIVFAKPLFSSNYSSALLLLSSLKRTKNLDKLIVLFANGDCKKKLLLKAKELHLVDNVRFMSRNVPSEQIPDYLAAADLLVLTFAYAPTVARSLLEAMAMGKPLIVTNLGEIPHILKHREHAILVDKDPRKIAQMIDVLLGDSKLSKKLSDNLKLLVKRKYARQIAAQTVLNIYRSFYEKKD